MVFKRREKRSWLQTLREFLWPRGGWGRAAQYVRHRLQRLPDSPETIGRGIFAGVFAAFTPFYGLHFLIAAGLAYVMRGNVVAALLGTFFGNPLTYVPIGVVSMQTGWWFLGRQGEAVGMRSFFRDLGHAWRDVRDNIAAHFTDRVADWRGVAQFYDDVFLPYLIGGIVPGIICASVLYYISVPLIRVYQARRKGAIKARLAALRDKTPLRKKTEEDRHD